MGFLDTLKKYSGYDATKQGLGQLKSGDFSGLGGTIVGQLNSADVVGNQLGLPHLGDPMAKADTSGLLGAANQSSALAGQLGDERKAFMNPITGAYGGAPGQTPHGPPAGPIPYSPTRPPAGGLVGGSMGPGGVSAGGFGGTIAPQSGGTLIDQNQIGGLRDQQQAAINGLAAAAAGNVPSPAELQAQRQAQIAGAQQFGQAAALQGGMSSGGALRNALQGSAQLQGDIANQGAILRAQEQANARNALVGALSGARGQEQDLATGQAGLNQQNNLANLTAQLNNSGQNLDWMKALLSGQLQSQNTAVTGQGQVAAANASAAAAKNARDASILGTGASLLGAL